MNPKEQELIKALKKFYGRKKNAMHKVALEMWSNNDISDEGYHQLFPENKPDGSRAKTVGSRPTCDHPYELDKCGSPGNKSVDDEDDERPQFNHSRSISTKSVDGCGNNFNQSC